MIVFLSMFILLFPITNPVIELPDEVKIEMVEKINKVRAKGCQCGQKYFDSAPPVTWDETLYQSALHHAKDMWHNNFFDHYSSKGHNIGQRLDAFGYYWQFAGENLGEGQITFDEVLQDWIKSPSHCEMLMNKNMAEVGVAKFKRFWVQHFGKKIPPGARRIK